MSYYTVSLWDAQRGEALSFTNGAKGLIIEHSELARFVESAHREGLRANVARAVPADIDRVQIYKEMDDVTALLTPIAFAGGWRISELDDEQCLLKILVYPKISEVGELVPKRADPL